MKWFLLALLAIAAAIGIATFAIEDPGYVLIARTPYSIETSLTFFIGALIAIVLAVTGLIRFTWYLLHTPGSFIRWRTLRLEGKARRQQARGLLELVQGEWASAQSHLLDHLHYSDTPYISYLAAAVAASRMGMLEQRDAYLARAHETAPGKGIAVGLVQARLQHDSGQHEQALATLQQLHEQDPRNTAVLRLMIMNYRRMGDWAALERLLPDARKRGLFSDEEMQQLERGVYGALLANATGDTAETVERTWSGTVPRRLQHDTGLLASYARALMRSGAADRAEHLLRTEINKHGAEPQLASLYGQVEAADAAAQLKTVEKWLKQNPESPELLVSAARISMRNQIWGRARTLLENALAMRATAETHLLLGELLDRFGEQEAAHDQYRLGLNATLGEPEDAPAEPKQLASPAA